MKTLIFSTILCCVIALPAVAELTPEDLDKIRLIVNEVVDQKIAESEIRMKEYVNIKFENVDQRFDDVNKRFDDVNKRFDDVNGNVNKRFDDINGKINMLIYFLCGLIALIAIAIIPQYIFLWRSQKTTEQDRINQELRAEIETLKQKRIVNP